MLAEPDSTDLLALVDRLRHRSQNWYSHHRKVQVRSFCIWWGFLPARLPTNL